MLFTLSASLLFLAPAPDPKRPSLTVQELVNHLSKDKRFSPDPIQVWPTDKWPRGRDRLPKDQKGHWIHWDFMPPADLRTQLEGPFVAISDLYDSDNPKRLGKRNLIFCVRCPDEETARSLAAGDTYNCLVWGRFFFAGNVDKLRHLHRHLPRQKPR